jgi:phosphatidylglycerol:prolipoprotein diacylglycerol transferase
MHPILLKIGYIKVYSYGLMVALGFLLAVFLSERDAKKQNIPPNLIMDLSIIIILFGLLGARIFYAINNLQYYLDNPKEIFMLAHGGLIFYGGALSSLLAAYVFLSIKKVSFLKIADILMPYIVLAHSIGRIGCFLNGCCWGKPTSLWWKVTYPGTTIAVHPTQIYESILLLALFVFLKTLRKKSVFTGQVFLSWAIFYGLIRFLIEFLRGDNRLFFAGLTLSQIVSAVLFFIGILFYFYNKKFGLKKNDGA